MIPASVRIFVCTQPIDMRCAFDRLALIAKQLTGIDPMSGALFVFANKRFNRLKVLWWDKNGYALLYKRLHRAVFRLPRAIAQGRQDVSISSSELAKILEGVALPPRKIKIRSSASI